MKLKQKRVSLSDSSVSPPERSKTPSPPKEIKYIKILTDKSVEDYQKVNIIRDLTLGFKDNEMADRFIKNGILPPLISLISDTSTSEHLQKKILTAISVMLKSKENHQQLVESGGFSAVLNLKATHISDDTWTPYLGSLLLSLVDVAERFLFSRHSKGNILAPLPYLESIDFEDCPASGKSYYGRIRTIKSIWTLVSPYYTPEFTEHSRIAKAINTFLVNTLAEIAVGKFANPHEKKLAMTVKAQITLLGISSQRGPQTASHLS